jgi:hypothetical protein
LVGFAGFNSYEINLTPKCCFLIRTEIQSAEPVKKISNSEFKRKMLRNELDDTDSIADAEQLGEFPIIQSPQKVSGVGLPRVYSAE